MIGTLRFRSRDAPAQMQLRRVWVELEADVLALERLRLHTMIMMRWIQTRRVMVSMHHCLIGVLAVAVLHLYLVHLRVVPAATLRQLPRLRHPRHVPEKEHRKIALLVSARL